MSLFGSNSPFYIVVHQYDKNGQCLFVAVLGEQQTFDDTYKHFELVLNRPWVAVNRESVYYDMEFVESTPMCIYHPHGCTEKIPVRQTDEIVHECTVRFDGNICEMVPKDSC